MKQHLAAHPESSRRRGDTGCGAGADSPAGPSLDDADHGGDQYGGASQRDGERRAEGRVTVDDVGQAADEAEADPESGAAGRAAWSWTRGPWLCK